jgi:di/tricarboxylate transporter
LSLREAYDAIDWPILVLLGSLIPVGEAIRITGTTDLIAGWISHAPSTMPIAATLALLLVISMLLTPLVHHAAVAVGASCDFLSPIGHQCNTLVMGPGGNRFSGYWHLGLPLSILVVVLGTPLILAVWTLH